MNAHSRRLLASAVLTKYGHNLEVNIDKRDKASLLIMKPVGTGQWVHTLGHSLSDEEFKIRLEAFAREYHG